jgi:NAD(P)-dependent dehydrogenase (short-subunit alcohol dehydrogenase family)
LAESAMSAGAYARQDSGSAPFAGRVVLVTGAGSGIGREVAEAFGRQHAVVALLARNVDSLLPVAGVIEATGGRALALGADVRDAAAVTAAMARIRAELGTPDIVVNSAGVAGAAPSETLDEESWDRIVDTNLKGTFLVCQAAGKLMLERRQGAIVNLASIAGLGAFPKRAAYSSSKAGVVMLTKVLASEWADRGVRVNAVAPGVVRTEMNERMIAAGHLDLPAIERRTPMHRRAEASEVADAVLFLASGAARYITGACLEVDGGWTSYGFL